MTELTAALQRALDLRAELLPQLRADKTDCYRLFHGATEGRPGLAVDRYGPQLLVQTWRHMLDEADLDKAFEVSLNAKTQRLGTCNTMETLLVAEGIAQAILPRLAAAEERCEEERRAKSAGYRPALHVQILSALLAETRVLQTKASGSDALRSAI